MKKDSEQVSQPEKTKAKKELKTKDKEEKEDFTEGLRVIKAGGRILLDIGQFNEFMAFVQ